MTGKPTGTVTFLFTDIEGSTRLARQHPDSWEAAQQRHHKILGVAIEARIQSSMNREAEREPVSFVSGHTFCLSQSTFIRRRIAPAHPR